MEFALRAVGKNFQKTFQKSDRIECTRYIYKRVCTRDESQSF